MKNSHAWPFGQEEEENELRFSGQKDPANRNGNEVCNSPGRQLWVIKQTKKFAYSADWDRRGK
jgi:hypothetical protein